TVTKNLFEQNNGPAIIIVSDDASAPYPGANGNRISQNHFSNSSATADNAGIALDLLDAASPSAEHDAGDGITLNDGSTDPDAGNLGLDYPVIASASIVAGSSLVITGWARPGVEIEFYEAAGTANDQNGAGTAHGEGFTYLFSGIEGSGGDTDPATGSYSDPDYGSDVAAAAFSFSVALPAGISAGDEVSAIAIDGGNNTSEYGPNRTVAVVNTPPSFDQDLGDRTHGEGRTISLPSPATDPDGDSLTYSAVGLPPGLSINTSTGLITGIIDPGAEGAYATTITVDDTISGTDVDTFTWTITKGIALISNIPATSNDLLTWFNPDDPSPATNEEDIGTGTGTTTIQGMDAEPSFGTLYAAAGPQFGIIDGTTGLWSAVGPLGAADGAVGSVTIDDVAALAFDPIQGDLYGVHDRGVSDEDILFRIDIATGAVIADAFGAGVDYVLIAGQATRKTVESIAIDPTTGVMFGQIWDGAGTNTRLVTIDMSDGTTTQIGDLDPYDARGLTFSSSGQLIGVGFDQNAPLTQIVFDIDKTNAGVSNVRTVDNGENYQAIALPLPLTSGIYGAVFEDIAGDALAGGAQVVGDAANPIAAGVTLRLYRDNGSVAGEPDASDGFVGSTTTDASGRYAFGGIPDGDYWVTVDSASVAPSAGINVAYSQDDVWAEQTYGPTGSLSFDGIATYSVTAQSGPFYGGKQGDVSDSAASLLGAEHVASVGLAGVASVNNDFGFSFNAVTSTRGGNGVADPGATGNRTVQGSLRQFFANSNAVTGPNAMRFVPTVPTNGTDGAGNDWWRIDVTAALPLVTDASTTIDGRPYMPDGVSGRNDNGAAIGTGGLVGVGNIYSTPTLDPELEIRGDDVVGTGIELAPTADGSTITNVAVARFNFESVELSGLAADAIDSITIENSVFGATSPADFTFDPAAPVSSGITADYLTNGTIRSNLFRVNNQAMHLEYASTDNLVQANETRGANTGIYLKGSATDQPARTTIRGNAFMESGWWGVRMYQNAGDHTVDENTISLGGNYGIDLSGTTHTVSGNIVTSNGAEAIRGSAPLVDADITQNEFGGNGELAIDLDGDGITVNDDGDLDGGANAAINYPIVTSAYLLGGNLIVNGYARAGDRIEFYESVGTANDNNSSGTPHGEGVGYLFTATEGVADADPNPASYTDPGYGTDTTAEGFSFTVPAPVGLALGEQVSALSHQGGVGTSEFGPSVTVTIPPGSISGTVFEDVAGNVLNGPEVIGDAANPVVSGAEVRVYEDTNGNNTPDAGDALVAGPILTDAGGNYSVTSLFNGVTYWVTVNSTTIAPAAGIHAAYSATTPWAEQSYGPDDALCADGLGGSSFRVGAGPCYGGRAAGTADAAGALATAQHVARVVPSGAETGIDFGFSYNVVTHAAAAFGPTLDAPSEQGSLDQFVRNANAILGGNAMRFVPAVPANGGTGQWWRIDYTGTAIGDQIENVHDADTTIDGTAFSLADGATVVNSNAGFLGANAAGGLTVGVDDVALPQVARPELELVRTDGGTGSGLNFYHWTPSVQTPHNFTVRDLAISGFAQGISSSGIAAGRPTGVTFERIVVGSGPDAFTDPGYTGTIGGVSIIQADDGFIRNSLFGFFDNNAIVVSGSDGWTISGNEVRDAAQIDAISDGINHGGGTSNGLISANLVVDSGGMGIDGTMTGTTVTNNTITGSGQLATQTAAVRFNDGPNSATRNVLTGNIGPGIIITDSARLATITENRFGGNGGPAIDLVAAGGDTALGDGISLNDGTLLGDSSVANQCGTVAGDGNDGLDSPVISTADWALGTTTITGLACPGSTVQV
ncbi:MAG: hypothetical protein HKN74_13410, partial [Acidimicrobiia bacterium]|nr:hypothetical protein [Acidimicrobiia bacterium]